MLSRRRLLAGMIGALVMGGPAMAQDDRVTRSILRQLERQGFEVVEIRQTLLGRVRIVARREDVLRELVFDPRNGAILRDYLSGGDGDGPAIPDIGDYDDDDDGDDDDGDDDGDDGGGDDDGDDE